MANDQWIADATTEICALRRKTGIAFDDEIAHIIASHLPSPPEPGKGAIAAAKEGIRNLVLCDLMDRLVVPSRSYDAHDLLARRIAAHTIEPSEHERVVGQRDGLLVFAEFCERLEAKLAKCSDLAHEAWQHGFDAESIGDKDFCDQLAVISCETVNEVADAEDEYAALQAENERLRLEVIGQTAARRAFQQILSDHTTQCGPCTDAIHKAMNIAEQAREGGES